MLEQLQESCLSHIFDKWEKEKGVTENGVRSKSMVWKRGLPLESENVKAPHAQTTTFFFLYLFQPLRGTKGGTFGES